MSGKAVLAVTEVIALAGLGGLASCRSADTPGVAPTPNGRVPLAERQKRIVAVLDEMLVGPHSEILSVPPDDGRFLRLLAEATGAKHVVEIGTSNGYATLWFCLALQATGGRLTTFEIDPERVRLARENFKRAGVDGLVTVVEGDAHKMVTRLDEPTDILYIDADKGGYLDYLNKLLPLVRPGGLILAHDTADLAERMQDYLDAIAGDAALETVLLNEPGPGISVTLKKHQTK